LQPREKQYGLGRFNERLAHDPSSQSNSILLLSLLVLPLTSAQSEDDTVTRVYQRHGHERQRSGWSSATPGTNNFLVISNATKVFSSTGIVGNAVSANYNSVLITDPGTVWTNRFFVIGTNGSYNSLVISNGARLVSGTTAMSKT